MQETLILMRAGVPYDVAVDMDADERAAWIIASGLSRGGKYDWNTRTWKE